ncbi:MAG: hypothetical protein AB8D78_05290 [Akkermansiaceae bacterium]
MKKFKWEALNIRTSMFTQKLDMLNSERDEYARNLASYAANGIIENGASIESLEKGRRVFALAMQLSPRNKQALVAQFQLNKGLLPEKSASDYSPQVFARLLLTRGQLLLQQPGAENSTLAHYLIQLAAEIDPRNEDAVYASELIRLDHGLPDWKKLMNPPKPVVDSAVEESSTP